MCKVSNAITKATIECEGLGTGLARDWSLFMGKARVRNFLHPPQDRVKLFAPPLLKGGNFLRPPPITMAKTFSSRV